MTEASREVGVVLRRRAIDAHHAVDVPVEVLAVELDLQVRQAVGVDPFGQRLGQTIVEALPDVALDYAAHAEGQLVRSGGVPGGAN